MKFLGLEYEGKLLRTNTEVTIIHSASYSVHDVCVTLTDSSNEPPWLIGVDFSSCAENVANNYGDCEKAGYLSPINPFHGKCRVVEVTLDISEV